jgi:hypothetical protein
MVFTLNKLSQLISSAGLGDSTRQSCRYNKESMTVRKTSEEGGNKKKDKEISAK